MKNQRHKKRPQLQYDDDYLIDYYNDYNNNNDDEDYSSNDDDDDDVIDETYNADINISNKEDLISSPTAIVEQEEKDMTGTSSSDDNDDDDLSLISMTSCNSYTIPTNQNWIIIEDVDILHPSNNSNNNCKENNVNEKKKTTEEQYYCWDVLSEIQSVVSLDSITTMKASTSYKTILLKHLNQSNIIVNNTNTTNKKKKKKKSTRKVLIVQQPKTKSNDIQTKNTKMEMIYDDEEEGIYDANWDRHVYKTFGTAAFIKKQQRHCKRNTKKRNNRHVCSVDTR